MSRKTGRSNRLQLYDRGNIKCPICLTAFTRNDVNAGRVVTLEHVPPKFVGGQARCLTCKRCNTYLGRNIDQAAAIATQPAKVTINIMGKQGAFRLSDDGKPLTTPFRQYTKRDIENLRNTKSRTFTMGLQIPDREAVATSWIKAAYLAVFSLLGPLEGYDYVCGKALAPVRQQILDPLNRGAASKYVIGKQEDFPDRDILLVIQPVPCWMVKIKDKIVILPYNGNKSDGEPLDELKRYADMEQVFCGHHASWMFQTFGTFRTICVNLKGASGMDSLLGQTIRGNLPNGRTIEGICIKHMGESATLLCANGVLA